MFHSLDQPPAFIATLGLQPQIITRALDKLITLEPDFVQGTIIHTAAYRAHPNWPTFSTFQHYIAETYPSIAWEWLPIQEQSQEPVRDVNTVASAELAFKVIFKATKELKQQGFQLHGLIAGGRKSIIVYSMISAQMLFDINDKLWHVFSKDENVRDLSLRPHPGNEVVDLVEIPVFHLAGLMPMVRELMLFGDDPTRAIRLYKDQEDIDYIVNLQRFYDSCEQIDRDILLLRFHDYPNKEIAERVGTVESNIISRLHKVADRLYSDPLVKKRYWQKPRQPQRTVIFTLRPILINLPPPQE